MRTFGRSQFRAISCTMGRRHGERRVAMVLMPAAARYRPAFIGGWMAGRFPANWNRIRFESPGSSKDEWPGIAGPSPVDFGFTRHRFLRCASRASPTCGGPFASTRAPHEVAGGFNFAFKVSFTGAQQAAIGYDGGENGPCVAAPASRRNVNLHREFWGC